MLIVLLVALGHGAGEARAEDGLVIIGGTADDRVRSIALAAVESAAKQAGWPLTTRRLSRTETDGIVRCAEPAPLTCVPPALAAGGIHRVLVVTVDRGVSGSGAPGLVLLGKLIVTSSRDVIVSRRFCESCADGRLAQESTQLAEDLLRRLATQSGRTMILIEIKSEPSGAQIVLDGQRIGITNGSFHTFPGPRLVTLERDGYLTESIQVAAEEGKPAQISATLRASPVPVLVRAPGRLPARRSRMVAEIVMVAGVAVILGGIVLHAADYDPFPGDTLHYPDTAPVGTVFGVAGLAAVGAGTYLWWRADF